ncbi:hypothetical protein [Vibrio owensii]
MNERNHPYPKGLYLKLCMRQILICEAGSDYSEDSEQFADNQLLIATRASMSERLGKAAEKGRHGWWDKNVCTIEELYSMRDKALADKDHVSVLNFTAMIAMRESVE